MRTTAAERKARAKRNLIFLIALLVILVAGLMIYEHYEQSQQVQERGVLPEGFGQRKRVQYDGHTYAERPAQTTILVMGVDKEEGEEGIGARAGGQSDFLMLLVVDHQNAQIHQLQIDRDTMTEVSVLGILGNPVGTRTLQISLSHGFGLTEEACCDNTVNAVSHLLEGIEIDYYVSFNMAAMAQVNNLLGGVTVTLDEDYSDIDPAMTKGATLTLTDEQAAQFLRARMSVGMGTNEERMARQRLYLSGAADALRQKTSESLDFIGTFYQGMADMMTTNMSESLLANEVGAAYGYEVIPVETLPGEHAIAEDGFMTFTVSEGAAAQWVMNVCYELMDE